MPDWKPIALTVARRAAFLVLGVGVGFLAVFSPDSREVVFSACEEAFGEGHGWTYEEPS